ncbi:hypothetical protein LRS06_21855 [Hymenobacter sp. J193]|uniref:hypothetical protein n=1 Tax=Hymenobacter sp. J193 TaxID=2898429 RepID=UPI002150FE59|nr:hypothetical protein [Hymenobacter sp. J193]MCR5890376.1 hypothetical protein [Hymenobacter sp. J193]
MTIATSISIEQQARLGVTTGTYELYLPGQEHRILFANSDDQVLGLLDCYLQVDAKLAELVRTLLAKPTRLTDGINCWSSRVSDANGQVAYLAAGASSRRLPRHAVGDSVRFYLESESYRVTGLSLQFLPEEYSTCWMFHYGEGERLGWGVSERITRYGATAGEQARELQRYRDSGQEVYYRVVLAEHALLDVSCYNTCVAGPWQDLDRDAFREVVSLMMPYAFTIRLHRA